MPFNMLLVEYSDYVFGPFDAADKVRLMALDRLISRNASFWRCCNQRPEGIFINRYAKLMSQSPENAIILMNRAIGKEFERRGTA